MYRNPKINGLIMRPCSLNHEDNKENFKSTEFYTESNFIDQYNKHLGALEIITESAKIFIIENWTKIDDWSDIDVSIVDNTGKETHYYKFEENDIRSEYPGNNKSVTKFFDDYYKEKLEKSNPVEKIEDVVLDTSDGDFSLTINGNKHLWIDNQSVIIIADFIEEKLSN